jgi:DNA (cytosine-5)-methyltransferase 1
LEYARIQSFADNYRFSGTTKQIFEQIGNAVPVNLAKAVAKEVKTVLS